MLAVMARHHPKCSSRKGSILHGLAGEPAGVATGSKVGPFRFGGFPMLSSPNHTQVPNEFIEKWMPILSDSAVRCFLAICRKTIGWHRDKDAVSYSQLMQMTGLSRGGVAAGIKQLEEKDLVRLVRSGRRTNVYEIAFEPEVVYSVDQKVVYSVDTQKKQEKKEDTSLSASTAPAAPSVSVPSEQAFPKPTKADRDIRIKPLIDYYYQKFKEREGFDPTVNGGAWGKIFKRLLRDCDDQTIRIVIDEFFAYNKRTRFSIYDFERSFDNVYGRLHSLQEQANVKR